MKRGLFWWNKKNCKWDSLDGTEGVLLLLHNYKIPRPPSKSIIAALLLFPRDMGIPGVEIFFTISKIPKQGIYFPSLFSCPLLTQAFRTAYPKHVI